MKFLDPGLAQFVDAKNRDLFENNIVENPNTKQPENPVKISGFLSHFEAQNSHLENTKTTKIQTENLKKFYVDQFCCYFLTQNGEILISGVVHNGLNEKLFGGELKSAENFDNIFEPDAGFSDKAIANFGVDPSVTEFVVGDKVVMKNDEVFKNLKPDAKASTNTARNSTGKCKCSLNSTKKEKGELIYPKNSLIVQVFSYNNHDLGVYRVSNDVFQNDEKLLVESVFDFNDDSKVANFQHLLNNSSIYLLKTYVEAERQDSGNMEVNSNFEPTAGGDAKIEKTEADGRQKADSGENQGDAMEDGDDSGDSSATKISIKPKHEFLKRPDVGRITFYDPLSQCMSVDFEQAGTRILQKSQIHFFDEEKFQSVYEKLMVSYLRSQEILSKGDRNKLGNQNFFSLNQKNYLAEPRVVKLKECVLMINQSEQVGQKREVRNARPETQGQKREVRNARPRVSG